MASKTVGHESSSVHCDQCHNKVERGKMSVHLAEECAKVDRLREQSSDHTPRGLSLEQPQRECERKLQQMLERQQSIEERLQQLQQENQNNVNHLESVIRNKLVRNKQELYSLMRYNFGYQQRLWVIVITVLCFVLGLLVGHAQRNSEQGVVSSVLVQELKQQINNSFKEVNRTLEQHKVALQNVKARIETVEQKDKEYQKVLFNIEKFTDSHTPPYNFEMKSYQLKKSRQTYFESPVLYTHPGGYKFQLLIYPKYGQQHQFLTVLVRLLKGTYDDMLRFPTKFTFTLELLNHNRDEDHHTRDIECEATSEKLGASLSLDFFGLGFQFTAIDVMIGADSEFISHTRLEQVADKNIRYLKDNSLKFRVSNILVKENLLT